MSDTTNTNVVVMKSPAYDILKTISLVVLPALGALYSGLAAFWGFPNPVEVVGTITLFDTFLGTVLHISSTQYNANLAQAVDASHAGTLAIKSYDDVTG